MWNEHQFRNYKYKHKNSSTHECSEFGKILRLLSLHSQVMNLHLRTSNSTEVKPCVCEKYYLINM